MYIPPEDLKAKGRICHDAILGRDIDLKLRIFDAPEYPNHTVPVAKNQKALTILEVLPWVDHGDPFRAYS